MQNFVYSLCKLLCTEYIGAFVVDDDIYFLELYWIATFDCSVECELNANSYLPNSQVVILAVVEYSHRGMVRTGS